MKEITPKEAIEVLVEAFKNDPEYAFSWHCNIAMMCQDSMNDHAEKSIHSKAVWWSNFHEASNDAASRFMKLAFDVETSQDMLEDVLKECE